MSGVPKTTLRFGDLLGKLRALSILSYSCLWLITVKGYKTKSAKRKGTWSKVQRKPGARFQESSLSGFTRDVLNSPSNELWQHVLNIYQGNSLENQCPGFLLWVSHIGTLCLTCPQIHAPRRKACIQYKLYCLHKQFRHSEPFLSGDGRNSPKIQDSRCWSRANPESRPF